ncbi:hypothetical protein CRE_25656 [Caenorhabditis remanei]|uniref:Integrase catalytic domain-containing protein n=1 Tax=Caenorhabditis remanei TaxID=31234 RepID=E3ML95_CAERE|nr:hypothetical protein CRE_25656 [Caenorhabditis remanei]
MSTPQSESSPINPSSDCENENETPDESLGETREESLNNQDEDPKCEPEPEIEPEVPETPEPAPEIKETEPESEPELQKEIEEQKEELKQETFDRPLQAESALVEELQPESPRPENTPITPEESQSPIPDPPVTSPTKETMSGSGHIRTRIGWSVSRIEDILNEEEIPTPGDLQAANEDKLLHAVGVTRHLTEKLLIEVQRLETLDNQWKNLIAKDSTETSKQKEYLEKYGDYQKVKQKALDSIEQLHVLHDVARTRLHQMNAKTATDIETWDRFLQSNTTLPASNQPATTSASSSIPQTTVASITATIQPAPPLQQASPASSYTQQPIPQLATSSSNTPQTYTTPPLAPTFSFGPMRMQLPPLPVPHFNGNITQFLEFTECFDSLMNMMQLDNISRLQYLKASLQGEALELISGLPTLNQNYLIARQLLSDTYGGSLRLKHTLLQQLRDLPSIQHSRTPKDLHQFCVSVTKFLQQLTSFDINMDNMLTTSIIESKLPKRIIAKLYSNATDNPINAHDLISRLQAIARTECLVEDIFVHSRHGDFNGPQLTTMTTMTRHKPSHHKNNNPGHQQADKTSKVCDFCALPHMIHRSQDCRKYKSKVDRKQRAIELRLCFRCLGSGHSSRSCTGQCSRCHTGHHIALCSRNPEETNTKNGTAGYSPPNQQPAYSPPGQSPSWNSHTPRHQGFNNHHGRNNNNSYQYHHPPHQQQQRHSQQNRGTVHRFQPNQRSSEPHQTMIAQSTLMPFYPEQQSSIQDTAAVVPVNPMNTFQVNHLNIEEVSELEQCEMSDPQETSAPFTATTKPIIMMTVTLPIVDLNGKVKTATVFFDSGSNISYINSHFTEDLDMKVIRTKRLMINTFGSSDVKQHTSRLLQIVFLINDEKKPVQLYEVNHIANNIVTVPLTAEMTTSLLHGHYESLVRENKKVDILIGMDLLVDLLGDTKTVQLPNGLHLHITQCGPIISGREANFSPPSDSITLMIQQVDETDDVDDIEDQRNATQGQQTKAHLEKFWNMEHFGILDVPTNQEDDEVRQIFLSTITRDDNGRYFVRLLLRDTEGIPDNRILATFRLKAILKRLNEQPDLFNQYQAIFDDQLAQNFIELVPDENITDGPVVHYLAHHPVFKESSSSTKVRIVFDGSAKHKRSNRSLNDSLYTGERLLPEIAGVLLRARKPHILISADIQKAFLQLGLQVCDRDATRFLWIDSTGKIICYRYQRVPFGLKSSPYLLNATIREHLKKSDHQFAKDMQRSIYVDNVYVGVPNVEQAKEFYNISKQIFREANMNLCQFTSNSLEANQFFEAQEKSSEPTEMKLLGVQWDKTTDEFIIQPPKQPVGLLTKRNTLKTIASNYDPLGFIAPTTVKGKLFFQKLCFDHHVWDTPLSQELHPLWNDITESWKGDALRIPRQFFTQDDLDRTLMIELHVFTDASQHAFGAVAYLRLLLENNTSKCCFVMSKNRIAPLRPQHSIPQLEMVGVLTGVRLGKYIEKELDFVIDQKYLWSDSLCTIDLIQSSTLPSNRFMRNRIKLIQEQSSGFIFSHIPGNNNPADLLTRGVSFHQLKESYIWLHGPTFLSSTNPLPLRNSSQMEKPNTNTSLTTTELSESTHEDITPPTPLIDAQRFSSFHRLLRTIMVVLHFITKHRIALHLHAARAREVLYRTAQTMHPPTEACQTSLDLKKNNKGLWIFTGRVEERPLIYLPHSSITRLLVLDVHNRHNHSSPSFTLSRLRDSVWIPKGLSFVNKCIKTCQQCNIRKTKPYRQPNFAPFPSTRYLTSRPFEHVGTDYAGPFNVLTTPQQSSSCWFILFTCLYSRYTVVKVVLNMEAESFLHALRQLAAMFGTPKNIVCDNGSQLAMMKKVMEIISTRNPQQLLNSTNLPTFKYIPAHSPWAGGIYERVIGLIKESLRKIGIQRQLLTLQDFETILIECTAVINLRPISYVSNHENLIALRPVDFVFPDSNINHQFDIEPMDLSDIPKGRAALVENWSRSASITADFRRRWNKEYPQVLQDRRAFIHRQKHAAEKKPQVGDVVLIEQPGVAKEKWIMARILEVKPRSAIIKNGKTRRLGEYPFSKLFPIETDFDSDSDHSHQNSETEQKTAETTPVTHPEPQQTTRKSPRLLPHTTTLALLLSILLPTMHCATTPESEIETYPNSTTVTTIVENHIDSWKIMLENIIRAWILLCFLYAVAIALKFIFHMIWTVISTFIGFIPTTLRFIRRIWNFIWNKGWRNRRRSPRSHVILLTIIFLFKLTDGCSEIASLQATDHICIEENGHQSCTINTVSELHLRPNGTIGCFNIVDKDVILRSIEVQITGITSTCQSRTHFFSREFEILNEYSHRCPGAGSCVSAKCSKTTLEDDIEELSLAARKSPGFTRCYEGCGGWACSCFRWDSSCLFHRIYAEASSSDIFEVFTCPSWTTMVEVEIQYSGKLFQAVINHGIPYKIPNTNLTVTITGFSTPPTPLHGATFLKRTKGTDKTTVEIGYSFTAVASSGHPSKGLIGELQCATFGEADFFDCVFDQSLCECDNQGTYVDCLCNWISLNAIVESSKLPQQEADTKIYWQEDQMHTTTQSSALISLQIDFNNQSVVRLAREGSCEATATKVTGCASCQSGASTNVECISSYGELVAQLECPMFIRFISCSEKGKTNIIKIFSSTIEVDWNCTLTCGLISTKLQLQGQLVDEPRFSPPSLTYAQRENRAISESPLDTIFKTIENWYNNIVSYLSKTLFSIVIVVLIIFLVFRLFCFSSGMSRLQPRRRQYRYSRFRID